MKIISGSATLNINDLCVESFFNKDKIKEIIFDIYTVIISETNSPLTFKRDYLKTLKFGVTLNWRFYKHEIVETQDRSKYCELTFKNQLGHNLVVYAWKVIFEHEF